ncbi:hypothetical protein [Persicitalea jodogahamensis]|uniref:Uncharacterized protein n=1 Tax=Persicitalea jodogahamensis TaxID=402147 RepID=A0A8J3DCC0_9BACT|nr:hypothetical protein [Persicitalea jodogahamensis]GHB83097.1 hypothetical protein GCM10007390_42560 [Persicitalea jodogahamensis]
MKSIKIVVIHDNMKVTDPLLFSLRERFGTDNVILKEVSSEGLEYIFDNLTGKQIVLLDYDLGADQPHAPEIIREIRDRTSLIQIIIFTAKQFSSIPYEYLIEFINNETFGIIQSTADIVDVLSLVDRAAHQLETRVDCVLEEWISKRTDSEKRKPYITTKAGAVYTLSDLIVEIRKETKLGQQVEKSILQLATELLTSGKKELDD